MAFATLAMAARSSASALIFSTSISIWNPWIFPIPFSCPVSPWSAHFPIVRIQAWGDRRRNSRANLGRQQVMACLASASLSVIGAHRAALVTQICERGTTGWPSSSQARVHSFRRRAPVGPTNPLPWRTSTSPGSCPSQHQLAPFGPSGGTGVLPRRGHLSHSAPFFRGSYRSIGVEPVPLTDPLPFLFGNGFNVDLVLIP